VGEPFVPEKFQAQTARQLAIILLWILGATVAMHYIATVVILIVDKNAAHTSGDDDKDVDKLAAIFNTALPVLASPAW
jgi:hypothetical protein